MTTCGGGRLRPRFDGGDLGFGAGNAAPNGRAGNVAGGQSVRHPVKAASKHRPACCRVSEIA